MTDTGQGPAAKARRRPAQTESQVPGVELGRAAAMNHTPEFLAQARLGSSPVYLAMLGGALPLPDNIA